MRHAYLIIAHAGWEQLKILLKLLDYENNDIYIHIDKKAKSVPISDLKSATTKSNIEIYCEYKVYWGSFELVQTELLLFQKARERCYDYYHLISGTDMPIKSQEHINRFFEEHKGLEFVHFDTEERLKIDHEIGRRTHLYHFLQNYRRRYKIQFFNSVFTFLERVLLLVQMAIGVDRLKKYPEFVIKYGSQWVSITGDLVSYILSQQEMIYRIFKYTNCADELFIQSIVYNSNFNERLYDKNYDDNMHGNMRLIDMKRRGHSGNPYTWENGDWPEIRNSDCLFARKFSMSVDEQIINQVCRYVST